MASFRTKLRKAIHPDGGPETERVVAALESILTEEQMAQFTAAVVPQVTDEQVASEVEAIKQRLAALDREDLTAPIIAAIDGAKKPKSGGDRANGR